MELGETPGDWLWRMDVSTTNSQCMSAVTSTHGVPVFQWTTYLLYKSVSGTQMFSGDT